MAIPEELRQLLLSYQKTEITEHYIYKRLAKRVGSTENREILERIAQDELRHYHEWKDYTKEEIRPNHWKIWFYSLISRIFGFTFGITLMERGEEDAQENYAEITRVIPQARPILDEEIQHEETLLQMLDEERLRYTGSIVLGLNDALVELTGALAGLTLALQDTNLIALTGSITGIAAALSMGASEYLSTKSEDTVKNPFRASIYTGGTYLVTVLVLIAPYLIFANYFLCLACSLAAAVFIIGLFNYYVAVTKDEPFRERFFEMAGLSFGVAAFSFLVGWLMRTFLGIDA